MRVIRIYACDGSIIEEYSEKRYSYYCKLMNMYISKESIPSIIKEAEDSGCTIKEELI